MILKPKDQPRRRGTGITVLRDGREKCTPAAWGRRRLEVFERDNAICQGCGREIDIEEDWHCHHKNGTRGIGGGKRDDRTENLILLCCDCHTEEHEERRWQSVPRQS